MSPNTKRCCFGRFILGWSNADDKPLSFGSLIERSTLFAKNLEPKTKRFVSGDFMDSFKMFFLNFLRGVEENQKFGPIGFFTTQGCAVGEGRL